MLYSMFCSYLQTFVVDRMIIILVALKYCSVKFSSGNPFGLAFHFGGCG